MVSDLKHEVEHIKTQAESTEKSMEDVSAYAVAIAKKKKEWVVEPLHTYLHQGTAM